MNQLESCGADLCLGVGRIDPMIGSVDFGRRLAARCGPRSATTNRPPGLSGWDSWRRSVARLVSS